MSKKDISIITSLYRSEQFFPAYRKQFIQIQSKLADVGIDVELILVANDPTENELNEIDNLKMFVDARVLQVPRESLYKSWNRGIAAAESLVIGFWNVDDVRYSDYMIEAYENLQRGFDLVDAKFLGTNTIQQDSVRSEIHPAYSQDLVSPKLCVSPFFMFTKKFIEQAGMFDEKFKIAGDFEWCTRSVVRKAKYVELRQMSGEFTVHGSNLSNSTNPLEWVEINIVLLYRDMYHELRPVKPDLMQQKWQEHNDRGCTIPENIRAWLWGKGATQRYEQYTKEREAHPLLRRMRLALAKRGLFPSVEWNAHNKPK